MAHEFESRQRAEELYILDGLTLDQVAERTGIPGRTVEEWSRAEGWVEMRREYRKAQGEIRRQTVLYRLALLKKGIETLHPQQAFAWASVEQTAMKAQSSKLEAEREEPQSETREIRTPEDAVNALQDAIQRRLNTLLTSPDAVNLKTVREIKDSLAMVQELKAQYKPEDRQKGLSEETIRKIEKEVLGIA